MPRRSYPAARSVNGKPMPVAATPPPMVTPLADTTTPNLGLVQPEVGASAASWGYKLNSNFAILDNTLPTSGGTISGSLAIDGTLSIGGAGITFPAYWGGHNIAFGWTGGNLAFAVDGSYIGEMATTAWVGGSYATYGWVNGNFVPWSGGGFSGPISAPNITASNDVVATNVFASNDVNAPNFFASSQITVPNIYVSANINANNATLYCTNVNITGQAWKPGGGPWAASSDVRLKKNVAGYSAGLDQICALRPVSYQYNGSGGLRDDGKTYHGLVAQEVRPHMPEIVGELTVNGESHLTTDSTAIIFALVNSVRELRDQVAELRKQIDGQRT